MREFLFIIYQGGGQVVNRKLEIKHFRFLPAAIDFSGKI